MAIIMCYFLVSGNCCAHLLSFGAILAVPCIHWCMRLWWTIVLVLLCVTVTQHATYNIQHTNLIFVKFRYVSIWLQPYIQLWRYKSIGQMMAVNREGVPHGRYLEHVAHGYEYMSDMFGWYVARVILLVSAHDYRGITTCVQMLTCLLLMIF
jgi:hypothetical protein